MIKTDPIIAVKNVNASADWYGTVLGCKRSHGGNEFAVLSDEHDTVLLCLHQWGAHEHPTMTDPGVRPGNGLILYFRTDQLMQIRQNVQEMNYPVEEELHINPNSTKKEFALRDPDGYYIIVTEYHDYEG